MSQKPASSSLEQEDDEAAENQLILSESERIASVCTSFHGDLLSLIEENDRYREDLDHRARQIKKLQNQLKKEQLEHSSSGGEDIQKVLEDKKLECAELQLVNTMLKEKLRRLDPSVVESPLGMTSPYSSRDTREGAARDVPGTPASLGATLSLPGSASPLVSNPALLRGQLQAKVAECGVLEQEVERLKELAKDSARAKASVEVVKEQCRQRVEELQRRFDAQTASLKEDCLAIKNMILDREAQKTNPDQSERVAELQALVDKLQQEAKISQALRSPPSKVSSSSAGGGMLEEDLHALKVFLAGLDVPIPPDAGAKDLLILVLDNISNRAAEVDAKSQKVAEQKQSLMKAKKELDVKAVKLNSKISAFNDSVVKWNKKHAEVKDAQRKRE